MHSKSIFHDFAQFWRSVWVPLPPPGSPLASLLEIFSGVLGTLGPWEAPGVDLGAIFDAIGLVSELILMDLGGFLILFYQIVDHGSEYIWECG